MAGLCRSHCGDTNKKCKDLGHEEARGCLHRLRIKLHTALTPTFRVDDKALIAQRADIAQNRPSGCSDLFGQFINGRGSVVTKGAHDGVMPVSNINPFSVALLVTNFGTIQI
jgi:hypothetical protein